MRSEICRQPSPGVRAVVIARLSPIGGGPRATAEVLRVINASPGNLEPAFDTVPEKAMRPCGITFGMLREFNGEAIRLLAIRGVPAPFT